jgi:hypothetical protein
LKKRQTIEGNKIGRDQFQRLLQAFLLFMVDMVIIMFLWLWLNLSNWRSKSEKNWMKKLGEKFELKKNWWMLALTILNMIKNLNGCDKYFYFLFFLKHYWTWLMSVLY